MTHMLSFPELFSLFCPFATSTHAVISHLGAVWIGVCVGVGRRGEDSVGEGRCT